jgi:hypothetical protein
MDMSSDIGSLPTVRLSAEPFPKFGNFVVSVGISYVVTMNSQRDVYVSCHS